MTNSHRAKSILLLVHINVLNKNEGCILPMLGENIIISGSQRSSSCLSVKDDIHLCLQPNNYFQGEKRLTFSSVTSILSCVMHGEQLSISNVGVGGKESHGWASRISEEDTLLKLSSREQILQKVWDHFGSRSRLVLPASGPQARPSPRTVQIAYTWCYTQAEKDASQPSKSLQADSQANLG